MGLYTDYVERQRPRYSHSTYSHPSSGAYDLDDEDTYYREPARSKHHYGRSSYAGRYASQDLYDEPAPRHSTQYRSAFRSSYRPTAYKANIYNDDYELGYGYNPSTDYDSDYMYNVQRKRAFRAATGTKGHSGLKRKSYAYHTPAGRRYDYDTDYSYSPRSYRAYDEPHDHTYYGARSALSFSSGALYDADNITAASKRQDRRLLNAITNTMAITTGHGPPPRHHHRYAYGHEVPSYETHHYHRGFPAPVRQAVVLALKKGGHAYGDYSYHPGYYQAHRRHHRYHAPAVYTPAVYTPAITYPTVKSQTGYRQRTDFAVTTGAVQDAYRALGKLERGWAHEDYDVSPSYRSHHMHAHTIDPYRPAHLRDYGSQKAGVSSSTRRYHGGQYRPGGGVHVTVTSMVIPTATRRLGGHTAFRRADH